jgi:hypothetical protein
MAHWIANVSSSYFETPRSVKASFIIMMRQWCSDHYWANTQLLQVYLCISLTKARYKQLFLFLIYREYFNYVNRSHGSALHGDRCTADESTCLMADNVRNEAKYLICEPLDGIILHSERCGSGVGVYDLSAVISSSRHLFSVTVSEDCSTS